MRTMNPTANFFNQLPEPRGYRPRDAASRHAPPLDRCSFSKIGSTRIRLGRAIAAPRKESISLGLRMRRSERSRLGDAGGSYPRLIEGTCRRAPGADSPLG